MDLEFIIDNLGDLKALPAGQTSNYSSQYHSIARDKRLSKIAIEKCENIFHQCSSKKNANVELEVINRCKDLLLIIKDENNLLMGFPYSNIAVQPIDVEQYIANQKKESMKNLTIEEVEVTDYV